MEGVASSSVIARRIRRSSIVNKSRRSGQTAVGHNCHNRWPLSSAESDRCMLAMPSRPAKPSWFRQCQSTKMQSVPNSCSKVCRVTLQVVTSRRRQRARQSLLMPPAARDEERGSIACDHKWSISSESMMTTDLQLPASAGFVHVV